MCPLVLKDASSCAHTRWSVAIKSCKRQNPQVGRWPAPVHVTVECSAHCWLPPSTVATMQLLPDPFSNTSAASENNLHVGCHVCTPVIFLTKNNPSLENNTYILLAQCPDLPFVLNPYSNPFHNISFSSRNPMSILVKLSIPTHKTLLQIPLHSHHNTHPAPWLTGNPQLRAGLLGAVAVTGRETHPAQQTHTRIVLIPRLPTPNSAVRTNTVLLACSRRSQARLSVSMRTQQWCCTNPERHLLDTATATHMLQAAGIQHTRGVCLVHRHSVSTHKMCRHSVSTQSVAARYKRTNESGTQPRERHTKAQPTPQVRRCRPA